MSCPQVDNDEGKNPFDLMARFVFLVTLHGLATPFTATPGVAVLVEPNVHLEAGYAFADAGDLQRARQAFDSAVHLEPAS